MIVFFDTETSGLWRQDLPPNDQSQPNLVQIGMLLDDAKRNIAAGAVFLIRPEGWVIEHGALEVHGITEQRCHKYGVDIRDALRIFKTIVLSADRIVAHGVDFDAPIIEAALHKLGVDVLWWQKLHRRMFCTKLRGAEIMKKEGQYGGYQWQSLKTCHEEIVGEPFNEQHDAWEDALALRRVYYAMIDNFPETKGERT